MMNTIDILENEYSGDEAWQRFVSAFRADWENWQDKNIYISKFGDEDLAIVLTALIGQHAIAWFETPCGALDKKTPADVIRYEPSGTKILRSLLMRMP